MYIYIYRYCLFFDNVNVKIYIDISIYIIDDSLILLPSVYCCPEGWGPPPAGQQCAQTHMAHAQCTTAQEGTIARAT